MFLPEYCCLCDSHVSALRRWLRVSQWYQIHYPQPWVAAALVVISRNHLVLLVLIPCHQRRSHLLDLTPVLSVLRVILLVTLVLMCPKCHFPCLLVNNLESGRINVWIISVCAMCLNPCELLLPLCIWMDKLLSSFRFIN